MDLTVNGHKTFCYTGGKAFDASKPTVVFVHGVLNDHSVWILQTRYFAHHGWNVLAPDLPGHCRSAGEPPVRTSWSRMPIRALSVEWNEDRREPSTHMQFHPPSGSRCSTNQSAMPDTSARSHAPLARV